MLVTDTDLQITLVSANLLHNQPVANPKEDVEWIRDTWQADLIGCQEGDGYTAVLQTIDGYGMALASSGVGEDPILYNTATMRLVSVTATKVSSGVLHTDPDRYVMAGHFVTKTDGVHVWYFNTHANHNIEDSVKGAAGKPVLAEQTTAATLHFQRMATMVLAQAKADDSVVFWGGDFNVGESGDNALNWTGFPNYIFTRHNMISLWDELGISSSGRQIDMIGSCTDDPGVVALSSLLSPDTVHSDHRFIRAVYSVARGKSSAGAVVPPVTTGTDLPPVVVPDPVVPLQPVLAQPVGTWDHSVCCKKG